MKNLMIGLALLSSLPAFAEKVSIEVAVPETATSIVVTAKGVKVDTCNTHELEVVAGRGAISGTYSVYVSGTELPCMADGIFDVNLEGETAIDTFHGQPETIELRFNSEQVSNLKIDFK